MPEPIVAAVLAHQGGWDEALMVLVPIALIAWLLKLANDRATRQRDARQQATAAPDDERPADPAPGMTATPSTATSPSTETSPSTTTAPTPATTSEPGPGESGT